MDVVKELVAPAREDLECTEWCLEGREGHEKELVEPLVREIVAAKRRVPDAMQQFLAGGG